MHAFPIVCESSTYFHFLESMWIRRLPLCNAAGVNVCFAFREVFGKRGEIPPLPRNCKRESRAVCSHWTGQVWEGARCLKMRKVRRPASHHSSEGILWLLLTFVFSVAGSLD